MELLQLPLQLHDGFMLTAASAKVAQISDRTRPELRLQMRGVPLSPVRRRSR